MSHEKWILSVFAKNKFYVYKNKFPQKLKISCIDLVWRVSFHKMFLWLKYMLFILRIPTQLLRQKWNKPKVILIKWRNVLNVGSSDSRFLSILTYTLSTQEPLISPWSQLFTKPLPNWHQFFIIVPFVQMKSKKSSDFMYDNQIESENATIWKWKWSTKIAFPGFFLQTFLTLLNATPN